MRYATIAAAIAILAPLPVTAQSLSDTHELVWHPAGKTPAVTYRPRAQLDCKKHGRHHQAGKGTLPTPNICVVVVEPQKTPAATPTN